MVMASLPGAAPTCPSMAAASRPAAAPTALLMAAASLLLQFTPVAAASLQAA